MVSINNLACCQAVLIIILTTTSFQSSSSNLVQAGEFMDDQDQSVRRMSRRKSNYYLQLTPSMLLRGQGMRKHDNNQNDDLVGGIDSDGFYRHQTVSTGRLGSDCETGDCSQSTDHHHQQQQLDQMERQALISGLQKRLSTFRDEMMMDGGPSGGGSDNMSVWYSLPNDVKARIIQSIDQQNKEAAERALNLKVTTSVKPLRLHAIQRNPQYAEIYDLTLPNYDPFDIQSVKLAIEPSDDLVYGDQLVVEEYDIDQFQSYDGRRFGSNMEFQGQLAVGIESDSDQRLRFDLTNLFKHWLINANESSHWGRTSTGRYLRFSCPDCRSTRIRQLVRDGKPLLELSRKDFGRRYRRSAVDPAAVDDPLAITNACDPHNPSRACCTESLTIEPRKIGWGQVIYPDWIKINYCKGSCNSFRLESFHTQILDRVRYTNRGIQFPKSCCHATRRSDMTVLYSRNGEAPKRHVMKDLVVKGCGCS